LGSSLVGKRSEGLTDEEQRGLWGELRFLRDCLLPVLGFPAVAGWKGADLAPQDFQFENGAIEVKTTLAKQPQVVRITSERQLDDSAWPTLILYVIALEARDGGGETLPSMIASLRTTLTADSEALEQFEDSLLQYGYLDSHVGRYVDRGYLSRSETALHVRMGFPRLVEHDMPTGIGDVRYGLAVAACVAFTMNTTKLHKTLGEMAKAKKQRKRRNGG